jgi:glucokinase
MRQAIGIDIGGTKIRSAVVTEDGAIVRVHDIATPTTAAAVIDAIHAVIREMRDAHTGAVGIGVPGRVDTRTGKVFSGGFVDLSAGSFRDDVASRADLPVLIANDASLALIAEARVGSARGLRNVVLLTIGTGIGGAILADGELLMGRATAGQLGHVGVEAQGMPCLCGRRGCLETTSSGTALRRLLAAAGLATISVDELLERKDAATADVVRAWIQPLRSAIDSLVATLDPDCVVLGGGLGHAAARALAGFPAVSPWYQCDVVAAGLGNDAGVIGAALVGMESSS